MLSLKAVITIEELSAVNLVMRETYDENGNITGHLSDEEYQRQIKEMSGRAFFGLTVEVGDKHVRIHSAISSPEPDTQRAEREHMLVQGFSHIASSIYQNFSEQ